MIEIMVTSVLIPIVGGLIYMLKRQVDSSERHDKWMVEQCDRLMTQQDKITVVLQNHFKTDEKMQGRVLKSLRIIARELQSLNKRVKP